MKNKVVFWIVLGFMSLTLMGCWSQASRQRAFDYSTPKLVISNGGLCVNAIHISTGRVEDVTNGDGWFSVCAAKNLFKLVAM